MFATLYVPNFLLQAVLRHSIDLRAKPVAVIDDETAKAAILELNDVAEQAGVCRGMAPSQGLARCLSLIIKMRDRVQEKLLADTVLQFAFRLSPDVEATAMGVWTIQFTDTREIEEKVARLISDLASIDIAARAGIAITPDASLLAAHAATTALKIDDARKFLASLPIEVLATV